MKRNTALVLAVMMVCSILCGGVVFLSAAVRAVEYPLNLIRSDLPIVSAADVGTNGIILCTDGTNIVRAGANENNLYPFVTDDGQVSVCSSNSGKVYISDTNGTVSTLNADRYTYQYNQDTNKKIYRNSVSYTGYQFSIPSSGTALNNCMYDAAVVLFYNGSYKAASLIAESMGDNISIRISTNDVLDITDAVGSNTTYGYVVRVDRRIYVIADYNNTNFHPTRFKLTNSDYINIDQIYNIEDSNYIYGYYDYWTANVSVLNFNSLRDAMEQVYYWETGNTPNPDPDPEPDPDPDPDPDPEPPAINGGITFILKPGYACDIYYGGESYDVTAYRYGIKSSAFRTNGFWWPFDNVLYATGVSSPIAQNIDIYNSNNYSQIPWEKAPPYSWFFGVTENAVFSGSGYDGHTIICNPIHYYGATANTGFGTPIQEQQTPIKITVSDEESQLTIYCWSLADSVENGVIHSTTVSRYKLGGDGMWYDANDDMVILEIGGETEVESDQQATLDDLVSNLDSFFTGTWRHIRQLVTSAGKLPSVVIEMYSWLPDEYKAVLFSAFGVVIVVAILKVML